jgi:hypothetical protein
MASKSTRPRKEGSSSKRKKKCELGTKCPYQHEYQHTLEFLHEPVRSAFTGTGHMLSHGKSTTSCSKKNSTILMNSIWQQTPNHSRKKLMNTHMIQTSKQMLQQPMNDSTTPLIASQSYPNLPVVIDLCDEDSQNECNLFHSTESRNKRQKLNGEVNYGFHSRKVPILKDKESYQLAQANAPHYGDVISAQDQEYMEAIQNDIAEEQINKFPISKESSNREILLGKLSKSKKTKDNKIFSQDDKIDTSRKLTLELNESNSAIIAFRLPSSCKVSRLEQRFSMDAIVEHLVYFLRNCKELKSIRRWTLCQVIGGMKLESSQKLKDLGLTPRGLVFVREET